MSEDLKKYREDLVKSKNELCHSYDKLLVTLSGGALALSITFLKDVVSVTSIELPSILFTAWVFFVLSLAGILGEIMCGIEARKTAIQQIDAGTIYDQPPGGKASEYSKYLHWSSAASLLIGLFLLSLFAFFNIGGKSNGVSSETDTPAATTPTTSSASATPAELQSEQ